MLSCFIVACELGTACDVGAKVLFQLGASFTAKPSTVELCVRTFAWHRRPGSDMLEKCGSLLSQQTAHTHLNQHNCHLLPGQCHLNGFPQLCLQKYPDRTTHSTASALHSSLSTCRRLMRSAH